MSNIGIIIGREFNERVRKKSFIVSTLLMPLLLVGLMAAPGLILSYAHGDTKEIIVLDRTGRIAPQLESDEMIRFEPVDLPLDEARRTFTGAFGILEIGPRVFDDAADVRLYTNASSSMAIEEAITTQIDKLIERERLKAYRIDDIDRILSEVKSDLRLQVFRNDAEGEPTQSTSSALSGVMGMALGMILYMFLLIYGAMVMQSVIEEKNSRVLEVMVSSVRPFDLMMGKILGVASVAVVQIVLWGVLIAAAGTLVLPHLMSPELMQTAEAVQRGTMSAADAGLDPEMLSALNLSTDVGYIAGLFGLLLLFMVGGYLLYSALFAAIGSAVDNVQDASQLQTPLMIPIILSIVVMMAVFNDPDSQVAFWFSIIPFTSPVVMMARVPYGIPAWEIVLALVLLYASFVGAVWLAAKIYRVGIFMYGKKPSLRELAKWVRYR